LDKRAYSKKAYATRRLKLTQQRPRNKPPTRLIILLIGLLLIFYLIGLISRNLSGGRVAALEAYVDQSNKIVEKSNQVAKGFEALKSGVEGVSRKELRSRLSQYTKDSQKISRDSNKIEPPEEMKEAHLYLAFCLELRAKGLEDYRPALFNALKDIDLEVASGQVSISLKDLALSDRAYLKFMSEVEAALKKEGVKKSIVVSKFLPQDTAYEKASIIPYLQQLKGVNSLKEVHGVGIAEFTTDPKQIKFTSSKKLATLPSADTIKVEITIENQGNQIELNIPVTVALKSETQPKEQKKQMYVTSLLPDHKKTIVISGLEPTQDSDVVNLLTVTVGPVPKEKLTDNNVNELKFIME